MKDTKKRNWAASLKNLRLILGITQADLAELVGVSTILIKKVECGDNCVTRKLGAQIQMATGATIGESKVSADGYGPYKPLKHNAVISVWTRKGGVPFTADAFKEHRASCRPQRVDDMVEILTTLFNDASRVKTGKLHGLRWSFMEWAREARQRFNLPVPLQDALGVQGIFPYRLTEKRSGAKPDRKAGP